MSSLDPRAMIANLPLRHKLVLITLTIVLLATVSVVAFLRHQANTARTNQFIASAEAQSRLVAEYAVGPLVFDDAGGAKQLLSKLLNDPSVAYVQIDDLQGRALAQVGGAPTLPAGAAGTVVEDNMVHVTAPIVQNKTIGMLRAGYRLDVLDRARQEQEHFLIALLLTVLLASYVMAEILQRIISRPLQELAQQTRRVAESHDYTPVPQPARRDEVGRLIQAYNHLLEGIRQREDDILALNRSLEAKVAERTQDLQAARDRADRANASKSEFLANMSHEIRTPINAITGFGTLALRADPPPRVKRYLQTIDTAAKGLLRIVNDLLDFSKIEAGHMTLEQIPFSLSEVLEHTVAAIGPQAEQKGLELLVTVAPDIPARLIGDPVRLGQILVNLCGNAVKFTEQGEVDVRVSRRANGRSDRVTLCFDIRDTGIGLTDEQIGRLFQAFTQADTSTTRRFGGTGLGLVICRRLLELMGGTIQLESTPNVGTQFHLEIALDVDAPQAAVPSPAELVGCTALVVDDNANARQILLTLLQQLGLQARAVADAEQALAELRRASASGQPYPLVLMDWRMPGLDGIAATRAIRADPSISGTPVVIMVTAYGREQAVAAAESASLLDGVLLKPVTVELLAATLQQLLNQEGGVELQPDVHQRLPGVRVLLVEDHPVNQQLAMELLEYDGAVVTLADNGRIALELLQERGCNAWDVALVDLQMPEIDGYETARQVRSRWPECDLPLIAMTAHAMNEERERCFEAGMQDHIPKPVDPEKLVSTVAAWVGGARLAEAERRPVPRKPALEALPEWSALLPDIDVLAGVKRSGGDPALYHSLLRQLLGHLPTTLAPGAAGAEQAHGLRGAAANLGLVSLAGFAGKLEVACRDGVGVDTAWDELQIAMTTTKRQLSTLLQQLAPAPVAESMGTDTLPIALDDVLNALEACLENSDTMAERHLATLQAAWRSPAPWLPELANAIEELDYPQALAVLREHRR